MAPRTVRRQKANASYNAVNSSKFQRKYSDDQDETCSASTASPATSTNSDSDQDWSKTNVQDTPPARTSLRSLATKAKDFVPGQESEVPLFNLDAVDPAMMPPPFMPTPGKDCLASVIQTTLGGELWNLNMMDGTGYNGEWFTAVEITIPALSASKCHLVTSQDPEAIDAAQQETQSQAVQSLTKALQELKPNMVVQPADHRAQLCVEFCAAERTHLCQEFAHSMCCHRGNSCRWAHAMIETFMINFILAPLEWGTMAQVGEPAPRSEPAPRAEETANAAGRWKPQRPPKTAHVEPLTKMPVEVPESTTDDSDSGTNEEVREIQPMKPLKKDLRPKNPRLASKKSWVDMDEDSDSDSVPLSFNT